MKIDRSQSKWKIAFVKWEWFGCGSIGHTKQQRKKNWWNCKNLLQRERNVKIEIGIRRWACSRTLTRKRVEQNDSTRQQFFLCVASYDFASIFFSALLKITTRQWINNWITATTVPFFNRHTREREIETWRQSALCWSDVTKAKTNESAWFYKELFYFYTFTSRLPFVCFEFIFSFAIEMICLFDSLFCFWLELLFVIFWKMWFQCSSSLAMVCRSFSAKKVKEKYPISMMTYIVNVVARQFKFISLFREKKGRFRLSWWKWIESNKSMEFEHWIKWRKLTIQLEFICDWFFFVSFCVVSE